MRNPSLGDKVHYTVNGECHTALVMARNPDGRTVDLIVQAGGEVSTRRQVPPAQVQRCGELGNPGTWHSPEQPLGVPAMDLGVNA